MQMKKNYVIFDPYYTNREGAWYFAPDEGEFCQGKACYGFGSVKYFDGSVYIGELYYDGETFNKLGYGQQNFIRSRIADLDRRSGLCKNVYVGSFDYRKTDWIYGNGVMYYMDEQNKPLCFAKGFFEGVQKVGEYQGTFDYDLLLKGYTRDMEIDREDTDAAGKWLGKQVAPWKDKSPDVLFVGDSYFELGDHDDYAGKHLFGKIFPSTYVNIGIGGSRFCDWADWIDSVENIAAPQKIVVNLGFNDIHCNMAADKVFADYKTLLGKLRGFFPTAKVYLVKVVHAPLFDDYSATEAEFNRLTDETANALGVTLIDWSQKIAACKQNCFHADGVHPNEQGYVLFEQAIADAVANK